MSRRTILTIVGARPQFVKAGPVSRLLKSHPLFDEKIVHTGQHFDDAMSKVFFDQLQIPAPFMHLGICRLPHGAMTGRMLEELERVMMDLRPAVVLVYGDTNSTLAGALAAAKLHIPIAHVEAGLRSFNNQMPEEINRVLTDRVSRWLFCPTETAVENLYAEGMREGVYHTGDVMYDAALFAKRQASKSNVLERLHLYPEEYAVLTLHREENTADLERLQQLIDFAVAEGERAGVRIVCPLHPRTRQAVEALGADLKGIETVPPLPYFDMVRLVSDCSFVMTDSGGLQKEAYFFRKPCITLREETEWVETIEAGWNRLWRMPVYRCRRDIDEYGNGQAAEKIVRILEECVE